MISVIVPVRNGARLLPEQLAALGAQTYAGEWELIVVDNGSDDGTRECALAIAKEFPRLRLIDASDRIGVAHARNAGAAAADGEFLLFCDSDDRVHPDWLEAMAAAMTGSDALGGSLDWATLNSPATSAFRRTGTDALIELAPPFLPFPSGANCGVRPTVFRALGGFDEDFVGGGDEIEFFWRLQLAAYQLRFVRDARTAYRVRPTLRGAARQYYAWARQEPHLYRAFRSDGMRRSSWRAVARAWGHLLVRAPWYWSNRVRRRTWVERVARRVGRIVGSVRYRVVYL